ncbi:B12-binding domain-containing radical SAM protein [bacterium]|nr:B12-binding domain-containing radical SAM protein [bacterium]
MANIVLISLYDRNAYAQRLMSANLKKHGHRCHLVFLKRYETDWSYQLQLDEGEYPWMGVNEEGRVFKYASNSRISARELELLTELIERLKPDFIGMTVNTPLRVQNRKVTQCLKDRFNIPVVWGGYDPTVNPRQCLDLCDYVCIGEGDETILELARCADERRDFDEVCNLAYRRRDGHVVMNPRAPVEQNIDVYPWRDDSPEDKYFIDDDRLIEHYPVVNDRPPGSYQTMSARGCPYQCSYCCEATLKELYSGEKFLRRRSPEDMVEELAQAKRRLQLNHIRFEDEIFGIHLGWLKRFLPLYRERIGLPFDAYLYPSPQIEEILTVLKEMGLAFCCLGLESGSERINKKVFERVYNRELFLKTVRVCKELDIPFYTDVITYNPYEDEEDLRKTLDVLLDMRGGYTMCINKLFVLPGTKMAEQMAKDGRTLQLGPERERLFNFYCRLFWLASYSPHARPLVRLLQAAPGLRRRPELINPKRLKPWVASGFGYSWLKAHTPPPLKRGLKKLGLGPRGGAPVPAGGRTLAQEKNPDPACR